MEENNTPKPNQVMDIQPPKQPEQQPQPEVVVATAPDSASQPQAEEPVTSVTEVNEVQEAPKEQDAEVDNEAPAAALGTPALAAVAQPKEKRHTPILAVVSAVVVSGAFAALAVYAFVSSKETGSTRSTSQTTQPTSEATKATTTDVDNTTTTIDDSLKTIDDSADYNDDAVSDTTLGL